MIFEKDLFNKIIFIFLIYIFSSARPLALALDTSPDTVKKIFQDQETLCPCVYDD